MDPHSSPSFRFQGPCYLPVKHCLVGSWYEQKAGRRQGCSKMTLVWRLICRMFKYGYTGTIRNICMYIQRQKPWECCQDLWFLSFHKIAPQLLFLYLFLFLRVLNVLNSAVNRSEILSDFLVQQCVKWFPLTDTRCEMSGKENWRCPTANRKIQCVPRSTQRCVSFLSMTCLIPISLQQR